MTDMDPVHSPAQLTIVRRYFMETLGEEQLAELHREKPWLDAATLAAMPLLFGSFMFALSHLPFGVLFCLFAVLQGFLLMTFGLVNHDLLMHRSVLPGRLKYIVGLCLLIPVYRSPTQFQHGHGAHHSSLGTAADSEQFKIDIDTPWRRFLYATMLGAVAPGRMFPRRPSAVARVYPNMRNARPRLRLEGYIVPAFTLSWIVLAFFFPRQILLGYVVPLFVVTPFVSTLRTIIEHSEFDPANPFQLSCYYRTNALTRCLFFWDSGDCHFAHHVFPRIPFYHITRAVRLMQPGFKQHKVIEHTSLVRLTWRWFAGERPYLSPPAQQ